MLLIVFFLHNALERSTMLLMGKLTMSMVIFNGYVSHYQRIVTMEYDELWNRVSTQIFLIWPQPKWKMSQ